MFKQYLESQKRQAQLLQELLALRKEKATKQAEIYETLANNLKQILESIKEDKDGHNR